MTVAVGANVSVQSRINGELGTRLDDGVLAATVSFAVGLACGLLLVAGSRRARTGVVTALRAVPLGGLRWWELLGGLGGAAYVAAQGVTVGSLGVALFTVCLVAGQTSSSLLVDRLGLGPAGVHRVSVARLVAAVLAVGAVALGVSDRLGQGDFRPALVALVVVAGSLAAFQQAFNGQVARVSGSAVVSGTVNFAVGFVALAVIVLGSRAVRGEGLGSLPDPFSGDWWLYLGGPMGFVYTLGLAVVVRILGVLLFGLFAIAGQLTGALLLDILVPTGDDGVTWRLVLAVLITFTAAALAGRGAAAARRAEASDPRA